MICCAVLIKPIPFLSAMALKPKRSLAAAELLRHQGLAVDCCKLVQVYPLPDGLCRQLAQYKTILFAEESVTTGGIGQQLCTALQAAGWQGRFILRGVDNTHLLHATVPQCCAGTRA